MANKKCNCKKSDEKKKDELIPEGFGPKDGDPKDDQYLAAEDMDQMPKDLKSRQKEIEEPENIDIAEHGTAYTKGVLFKDEADEKKTADEIEDFAKGEVPSHKDLNSAFCSSKDCKDEENEVEQK